MTSKLKCPICGGDIQYNDGYSTYDCKNNPANHNASEEIWKALIQSRQQLKMLEPIVAELQGRADINAEVARDSNELVVQWYEKYEQSQKDLEIARKALEEIAYGTLAYPEVMARETLELIEHKE